MQNIKTKLLQQFDELAENLEPEIYTEASYGDIDWKPFRKFLSKALTTMQQETERELVEKLIELRKQLGLVVDAANSRLETERSTTAYRELQNIINSLTQEKEGKV